MAIFLVFFYCFFFETMSFFLIELDWDGMESRGRNQPTERRGGRDKGMGMGKDKG